MIDTLRKIIELFSPILDLAVGLIFGVVVLAIPMLLLILVWYWNRKRRGLSTYDM